MNATPIDQPTTPLPVSIIAPGQQAALAKLAFGVVSGPSRAGWSISRHLAFLPAASLELDLDDPEQRQFGDYELIEEIGQGGMGVVYRANQKSLDREVAIKLLSAGPWASKDFIERFRREAQSAARMQHPNIVAIYEIGQHEELNFFSMRLVRGPSLAQVLRQHHRLPARECARLLRTIAEAVDYAHKLGVLHLDLKPGNVLVDDRGEPQVADFGLARRLDETLASDSEEISGTPSYMAPEQAQLRRHKLTPATDIYGLGAVLYECVTGRPPFLGADAHDTLRLVVETEPQPLRAVQPDAPLDLDAICAKCLSKEPIQRYRDARELAEDLGRFIEGRQVQARPLNAAQRIARWTRREPRVAIAAGTAALLLVAGLLATTSQWWRAERQTEQAKANAQRAEANAATARETAWRARRAEAWRLAERGDPVSGLRGILANLREQREAGDTSSSRLDRAFIATTLDAAPRLIDVIALGRPAAAVAVSHDGTRVAAAADQGQVWLFSTDSGQEVWRAELPGADPSRHADRLDFSPDNRFLIVDFRGDTRGAREMHRLDAATGRELPPPAFANLTTATYSGNGRRAILHNGDGGAQAWSLDPSQPLGPIVPLPTMPGQLEFSIDGELLVATTPTSIELRDGRTLAVRAAIPAAGVSQLTPDGRWLVVGRLALELGRREVGVYDTGTGSRVVRLDQLMLPYGYWRRIAFSEDSAWMVLAATEKEVRILEVATGKEVGGQFLSTVNAAVTHPLISRRGWLVFTDVGVNLGATRIGPSAFEPGLGVDTPKFHHARSVSGLAAHFDSGLVASSGYGGDLRLWRLPADPAMGIAAPIQAFDRFDFDGHNLPDVREATVVVRDLRTAEPRSPEMAHSQWVQAAQLARDGRTLVTVAGRFVHIWDWHEGRERCPALELPATPIRFAMDPAGRQLLTSFGENRSAGYQEVFRSHALSDCHMTGEHALPGSYKRLDLDDAGRVAMVYRDDAIERLDATSLAPLGPTIVPGPATTFSAAAVDRRGGRVFASVVMKTADNRTTEEHRWYDARSGRELGRKPSVFVALAIDVSPDAGTLAVQGSAKVGELVSLDGAFSTRRFAPTKHEASYAIRYSPDGELIFRSGSFGNIVTDARLDHPVTPLLYWNRGDYNRFPSHAAWSGDGERIALHLSAGDYAYYDLRPRPYDLDDLGMVIEATHPEKFPEPINAEPLPDRTRAALRRGDPGPPNAWQLRSDDGLGRAAIPPRAPSPPGELVDLGEHYTLPLVHYNGSSFGDQPLHMFPVGLQRFDGVDYDVRGVIVLDWRRGRSVQAGGFPFAAKGIAVAIPRIGAVSVLCTLLSAPAFGKPVAYLHFNYRDGSASRAVLIHGADVLQLRKDRGGTPPADATARLVWTAWPEWSYNRLVNDLTRLYAARLENPHPERDVLSLALEAADEPGSFPAFFALTLEPVSQPGSGGSR